MTYQRSIVVLTKIENMNIERRSELCPDPDRLRQVLEDTHPIDETTAFHLQQCERCQLELDRLTDPAGLEDYRQHARNLNDDSHRLGPPLNSGDIGSLDQLAIESRIGEGGMGIVYRGRDTTLGRTVAIKVLAHGSSLASDARFIRESKAAARLDHPNLVKVYSAGRAPDGRPYLVMPLIEGESLRDRLHRGSIPINETAEIIQQVAQGLAAAHEAGLFHRDVKPANILLDRKDGLAKLTDFGLVRSDTDETLTQHDMICGTPHYMSPEQAVEPETRDKRSDIYSLGIVLYECLTGGTPFRGRPLEILEQHQKNEPIAPSRLNHQIPRDLETICLKCLAKDPRQRYETASELGRDLVRFLNGETIHARAASSLEKLHRWCRREPRLAISIGGVAVLLLAFLTTSVVYSVNLNRAYQSTKAAQSQATKSRDIAQEKRDEALDTLNQLVFEIYSELQQDPGNLSARKQLLQVAVGGFEKLLATDPTEEDPAHGLIIAHIRLADVHSLLGNEAAARDSYLNSISLCKSALVADNDPQLELDLSAAYLQLGVLDRSIGDVDSAEFNLQMAIGILEQKELVFDQQPVAFRQYLDALFAMGWVCEQGLDSKRAVTFYLKLLDQIPKSIDDQHRQLQWLDCVTCARLTNCFSYLVEPENAAVFCGRFHQQLEILESADVGSTSGEFAARTIQNPAWAYRDVAHYYLRTGNPREAKDLMMKAVALANPLLTLHDDDAQIVTDVAKTYVQWAFILRAINDPEAADQAFETAIEIVESRQFCDQSIRAQKLLVYPYVFRMQLAQDRSDFSQAARCCKRNGGHGISRIERAICGTPNMISALTQTRRLLTPTNFVPRRSRI